MNFWVRKILLWGIVLFLLDGTKCWGKAGQETPGYEEDKKELQEEMLEELNLSDVEEAVDELLQEDLSFQNMVKDMMEEGRIWLPKEWKKTGIRLLMESLGIQRKILLPLLLLAVTASLMAGFSSVLEERQIGEVSFYIVYLFLFVLLLKNFESFASQIGEILEKITEFMRALLPSYFLALSASDGISTAGIFYQMIIGIIFLVEHLILKILLPGVRFYFLIELMNYLTKEEFLSKMTELLKTGIQWAMKTMVGTILGLQLIQRLISPAVDALKRTVWGRTAEAIPGVGNIFGGITEMVLGLAVLLKNCLGAAVLVLLLLTAIPPVIRLGVSSICYRLLAALIQPVTDSRIAGCIQTMGEGVGMLLKILFTVEILFFLTIAILAGSLG